MKWVARRMQTGLATALIGMADARPITLDSERVLLDALIGRLEQAAYLSEAYLASGSTRQWASVASKEAQQRKRQADLLRSKLKRWYASEPSVSFASMRPETGTERYDVAMRINHGQLAELIEFGQTLKLRRELRGFLGQLTLDCLRELGRTSPFPLDAGLHRP